MAMTTTMFRDPGFVPGGKLAPFVSATGGLGGRDLPYKGGRPPVSATGAGGGFTVPKPDVNFLTGGAPPAGFNIGSLPSLGGGAPAPAGGGYSGVPIVIGGAGGTMGSGSADAAIKALLQRGSAAPDMSRLDAYTNSLQDITRRLASGAASQAISKAYAGGSGGTPAQMVANQSVQEALERFSVPATQAAAEFLQNSQAQSLQALAQAAGQGTSLANLDLLGQRSRQEALFGSEAADLARSSELFRQGLAGGQFNLQALEAMGRAGALPREIEQANMAAQYGEFGREQGARDIPFGLLSAIMGGGGVPLYVPPPDMSAADIGSRIGGVPDAYTALMEDIFSKVTGPGQAFGGIPKNFGMPVPK